MKKFLFSTVALSALTLMATSCSDEQVQDLKAGAESTVTITAQLPGDMGTRAFADGTKATELHYAVYEKGTKTRLAVCKKADGTTGQLEGTATMSGLQTTISLQLTTGKEYDFVFWAAKPGSDVYSFSSENQTVSVNYTKVVNNTDDLDAFFGHDSFKVEGNKSLNEELRRPFAQINIGTDDYDAAVAAGYTVSESSVAVETYSTLNLLDETVSGATTATFAKQPIPTEDTKFTVNSKDYKYLSMTYVLVPKDKQTVNVAFDYTVNNRTFTNVPVQRNYRTNIYGSLLTNSVDFNVVIAPGFNDPDYNYEVLQVKGASQLKDLLASTPAAELAKKDVIVDLNGETLKEETTKNLSVSAHSVAIENGTVENTELSIKGEEGVTLKNVKVSGSLGDKNNSNARISVNTPGDIVVDGLDYTNATMGTKGKNGLEINLSDAIVAKNVTVKNSKFAGLGNNAILVFGMAEGGVVNVEDCSFDLADGGEAVRISNKTNTKFTVNAKNCNYKYPDAIAESNKIWLGFFLFQDYTNKANAESVQTFKNLTVNVDNVTFNGTKVTKLNLFKGDHSQFACMFYNEASADGKDEIITDASHFPTFNFK